MSEVVVEIAVVLAADEMRELAVEVVEAELVVRVDDCESAR